MGFRIRKRPDVRDHRAKRRSTARVAATADAREAQTASVSTGGEPIETISPDRVGRIVGANAGLVVVQYSSDDSGCGYCVLGNRHYCALAASSEPHVKYFRVLYEPWTSAAGSGEAVRVRLRALPTIVLLAKGKEKSRFEGDAAFRA